MKKITLILSIIFTTSAFSSYLSIVNIDKVKVIKTTESWGEWEDIGLPFNCSGWIPEQNTIRNGTPFSQEKRCSQNKIRKSIYIDSVVQTESYSILDIQEKTGTRPHIWVYCVEEYHGSCNFNSSQARYVRYGEGTRFSYAWKNTGVICSNDFFHDPSKGNRKYCWYDK